MPLGEFFCVSGGATWTAPRVTVTLLDCTPDMGLKAEGLTERAIRSSPRLARALPPWVKHATPEANCAQGIQEDRCRNTRRGAGIGGGCLASAINGVPQVSGPPFARIGSDQLR